MFSTNWPHRAACIVTLMLIASAAMAQESHLTLDDIDKLARQRLVDSMRKSEGGAGSPGGVGLGSPLGAAAPAPVMASAPVAVKVERKPAPVAKRVIPVAFVGAYSDSVGCLRALRLPRHDLYRATRRTSAQRLDGRLRERVRSESRRRQTQVDGHDRGARRCAGQRC